MGRKTSIPWDSVKCAFMAGLTLEACAQKFNLAPGTVFSRASREKWSRILLEAKEAARMNQPKLVGHPSNHGLEVLPPKEAHVVLAEDLAERGERHRITMSKMVETAMEKASYSLPPVEKMQDLKILDDIARRNFGLDQDQIAKTCILNLNILLEP